MYQTTVSCFPSVTLVAPFACRLKKSILADMDATKRNGDVTSRKRDYSESETFMREDVPAKDNRVAATTQAGSSGLVGQLINASWRVFRVLSGYALLESFCDRLTNVRHKVRFSPRSIKFTERSSIPGVLKVPLNKPRAAKSRTTTAIDGAVSLRCQDPIRGYEYTSIIEENGKTEVRGRTSCISVRHHKGALEDEAVTVHEFFVR